MSSEYLEKIQRINLLRSIKKEQDKIDKLYEKEGLTDRVLTRQECLDQKRKENKIQDTYEFF